MLDIPLKIYFTNSRDCCTAWVYLYVYLYFSFFFFYVALLISVGTCYEFLTDRFTVLPLFFFANIFDESQTGNKDKAVPCHCPRCLTAVPLCLKPFILLSCFNGVSQNTPQCMKIACLQQKTLINASRIHCKSQLKNLHRFQLSNIHCHLLITAGRNCSCWPHTSSASSSG